ncbi:MAG: 2-dehydro-3-deoxy-6-phosphogalactonate aldolase [Acidimicrobiia bacterium]|nr:MAG: 2-dehydro-3-deoxy-6-phosphogalactonate aldolase [Acidimicrobiia bacterium]
MKTTHTSHPPELQRIMDSALIAIVRGSFASTRLLRIAETLHSAGIEVLEVTMNSRDALTHIETLRTALPESMLVGAGTVRTARHVELAHQAGAQFALSPNLDPAAVAAAHRLGLVFIPGVLTPTEVHTASQLGCTAVKLFPACTLGPSYIRSLRAVFDDMAFIPTGGITASNVGEFRQAGAIAVGVGSALVSSRPGGDDDLFSRATAMRINWDEAA